MSIYIRSSFKLIRKWKWLPRDCRRKVGDIPLKYNENESKSEEDVLNLQDSGSERWQKLQITEPNDMQFTSVKRSTDLWCWYILDVTKKKKKNIKNVFIKGLGFP